MLICERQDDTMTKNLSKLLKNQCQKQTQKEAKIILDYKKSPTLTRKNIHNSWVEATKEVKEEKEIAVLPTKVGNNHKGIIL